MVTSPVHPNSQTISLILPHYLSPHNLPFNALTSPPHQFISPSCTLNLPLLPNIPSLVPSLPVPQSNHLPHPNP